MTPELRDRLMERLAVRSERLAKMAAINAPTVVIALMAAHVATTSILLLGDEFGRHLFDKLFACLREQNGICLCGNGLKAPDQPLCQRCLDKVEQDDRDCEEQLAMSKPTKGQPS